MTPPEPRRAALAFIFITIVLDMLALGMIIPVLPKLVLHFLGQDPARAAPIYGLFGTVWALMQLLFSPLLGVLSDRFGRRPVILISNFGLGGDYILMALAPSLLWLLLGRTLSGITAASISTASAYIADVTPPERRAGAYGLMGAAFGLGFILGPALGGLLGGVDPRLPFWAAAGLSLANGLYGLFVLPESLPKERRAPFAWRRANPFGALELLRSRPTLLRLSSISFLGHLAHVVMPSTFVLYATLRYGFTERDVGLALAGVGACGVVVQAGLVKRLVARLGERRVLLIGLCCGVLGFVIYGLAPSAAAFFLGVPVMSLWGLSGPAVQGLMTQQVAPTEQGRLQGALSSLQGVAGLLGPALFTQTFARAAPLGLPGASFLLAGLLLVAATLVALVAVRPAQVSSL